MSLLASLIFVELPSSDQFLYLVLQDPTLKGSVTNVFVVLTELFGISSVAISPDGGRLLEDTVPFLNRIDVVSRYGKFGIIDEARSPFSFWRGLLFWG